ncbi:MAG: Trm112 family protein [bacterium]|nr:Trm112 family protein [bacterium]
MTPLSSRILDLIACPACKAPLEYQSEQLTCKACALQFPVIEGKPVLVLERATKLSTEGVDSQPIDGN